MKLVTQFIDPSDAAEVSSRLREAGVMTEVSNVDPHIIQPSKSGASRIGLWVVFDDQLEDAVQLLENPEHVPKRVIAPDEMIALASSAHEKPFKSGRQMLETIVVYIFGVCLLGLMVYIVVGVLSNA